MTFRERYLREDSWHGKVMIMEIFHLTMNQREKGWTLTKTAQYFTCSIGLVSENLKLAHALHEKPELVKLSTRQDALKNLGGRRG